MAENTALIIILAIPLFGHSIPAMGLAGNLGRFAKVTFLALSGSLTRLKARAELTIQDEELFVMVMECRQDCLRKST